MSLNLTPSAVIKIKNELLAQLIAERIGAVAEIVLGDQGFKIRVRCRYVQDQMAAFKLLPREVDGCQVYIAPDTAP